MANTKLSSRVRWCFVPYLIVHLCVYLWLLIGRTCVWEWNIYVMHMYVCTGQEIQQQVQQKHKYARQMDEPAEVVTMNTGA